MDRTLAHFPRNPDYGRGAYRRRLVFVSDGHGMAAQVDDTHHSYWLTLDHDGERVVALDAGFLRAPNTACPGAPKGLAALVGLPVGASISETLSRLPPSRNCTHLVDLACWSLMQIGRSSRWDILIPDQVEAPVWIEIRRDGKAVHRWRIEDRHILAPAALAGRPLMKGFMAWARALFDDEALLAAIMLQRGLLVARGRAHIVDRGEPIPLSRAEGMAGMCWSYSDARLATATGSLNYVRDFTASVRPEPPPPRVAARLQGAGS